MVGDIASMLVYWDWVVRTYLLFVVSTIMFSNKAENYVDRTFLRYLRDLELVGTFAFDT
jgi:hypothetical protein